MSINRSVAVRSYLNRLSNDPAIEQIAQLPPISVSPMVGNFLFWIASLQGARRILEIGTLGGYSTLWLARALPPEGRLISLERQPEYVALARAQIERAGFEREVEIRQGDALELLAEMGEEVPFDLVFLDADKGRYPEYLERIIPRMRSGALLIADNLIPREEHVGSPAPGDREAEAIYRYNEMIATSFTTAWVPTIVGSHGRLDALGLSIFRGCVRGPS